MGFLEQIDTSGAPTIPEYFKGKTIFITGGSGFMGQALVEKLLYSCPELDRIYLLMRKKKGLLPEARLEKMYSSSCFDRLKKVKPNVFMQKVYILSGDVLELGLGLSDDDRSMLINTTNIIFNVAASIRFNDPLTYAVKLNVRGTREVVRIAKDMRNLTSFIHVSTCYSNCKNEVIDEVLYPPLADWREVLEICDTMDEETIRALTPKYMGGMPNTYVFTKQLAEHLVSEQRGKLPVVILRPSIVTGSLQEPAPGWTNNFNGPCGLIIALGKGIKRSIYGESRTKCNFIPLDVCIRNFIVTAWARGITGLKETDDVPIYNLCSFHDDMLTIQQLIEKAADINEDDPIEVVVWHVRLPQFTNIFLMHYCKALVYNISLALLIDFVLWISGRETRLMRLQRKIYITDKALYYFMSKNWTLINTKFMALREIIKREDKDAFYYSVEKLFEHDYLKTCVDGGKKYLLKEENKDTAKAKALAFRMRILDGIVMILFYGTLLWWIVNTRYMKILYSMKTL